MPTKKNTPPYVIDPTLNKDRYSFPEDYVSLAEEKRLLKQLSQGYYERRDLLVIVSWELFKKTNRFKKEEQRWLEEQSIKLYDDLEGSEVHP